ncbi:MAG: hypothetical protein GY762_18960 [Proteobacteria bacterium]|nr:hypothetical protein [Pseudomonadota bacterium]
MRLEKKSRLEIWKAMSAGDKTITVFFLLLAALGIGCGLYLVGKNGVLLLVGGMFLVFLVDMFRTVEIDLIARERGPVRPALDSSNGTGAAGEKAPVGAAANNNNTFVPGIIDKTKRNKQQSLLDNMMGNPSAASPKEGEQAKRDREILVEHFRQKELAMRKPGPTETADPKVQEAIIERQKAYVTELMKPTIIPQRELAEKKTDNG